MKREVLKRSQAALALTLLTLVASFGIAYAIWADQLQITGTVNTAQLAVVWLPSTLSGEQDPYGVGDIDCFPDPGGDAQVVHFQITNGYPGYVANCAFQFRNEGSVPARLSALTVDSVPLISGVPQAFDLSGNGDFDVEITLSNGAPNAIYNPPGGGPPQGGSLWVTVEVLEPAEPDSLLSFTGHLHFELP